MSELIEYKPGTRFPGAIGVHWQTPLPPDRNPFAPKEVKPYIDALT
jgi:hypothetical protein